MNKILFAIIIIAALFRLPFLGQFPNGFTGDEAQQGYSAYSILKTGRDEWGEILPLFPRGFGDYKPPLYTYVTIPSIAIFGLSIEAVRLPAAIIGILSVIVLYFLIKELFKEERLALLSSLFLAISPWHIQLSRTAWEGGLGVLTFPLGLLFFLKADTRNFVLAAFFWGLTLYTYHSWRVFVVLFIIGLLFLWKGKLLTLKNWISGLILAAFILPLLFNINSIMARSSDVGIFSQNQLQTYFVNKGTSPLPSLVERALDNKFFFLGSQFFGNFLSYFSPTFYFSNNRPDSSYLNFPYFPLLYPIEIFLWMVAIYMIITKNIKSKKIIILWLFLAIIPASLAAGSLNANRTPTLLPLTAIISAIGLKVLMEKINKAYIGVILLFSFLVFLHFYFISLPKTPPNNLRYGYDATFKKVLEVQSQYDYIVISKVFTEPQIFIAFYGKVDPTTYQEASKNWLRYEEAGRSYIDQLESWNFNKFLFEGIDWKLKDSHRKNALVVSKPEDFPSDVSSILDIKNPKGEIIYRLVPTDNAN